MSEEKKERSVRYRGLWKKAIPNIEGLSEIVKINIEEIEKDCSGDPEKCWKLLREKLEQAVVEL